MSDKINFHPYTVPQESIVIHLMVFTKRQKHRLVIVLRVGSVRSGVRCCYDQLSM